MSDKIPVNIMFVFDIKSLLQQLFIVKFKNLKQNKNLDHESTIYVLTRKEKWKHSC